MNINRRKLLTRALEGLAVTLVVLDIAAYFAILRPLQSRVQDANLRHQQARVNLVPVEKRVNQLEKYAKELPTADGQLAQFLDKHVPGRRQQYSAAEKLVARLSEKTGVQLTGLGYKAESEHKNPNPLRWLRIEVSMEGEFKNLMDFAYQLESGDDFLLIRYVSFDMGDRGQPSLRLAADLYTVP